MTGVHQATTHQRGDDQRAIPAIGPMPGVIGMIAGEERCRRYGARIAGRRAWLVYDSLEMLPHLLAAMAVEVVVVDLVRWVPVEAAPVLREVRQRWPALRIVGVYEPSADALPELAELAWADRGLAFAADADERFDLLTRPVDAIAVAGVEAPTVCRLLLEHFLPLAPSGVRAAAIHLALAPSRRRHIPALAAIQGCSEDALERRFADGGLVPPAVVRRIAIAAEGIWQVAALRQPAEGVAGALGLGAGDSLGRMIKSVFGIGLKAARLMGADGARRAIAWAGLLALRDLAPCGGLPALARVRFAAGAPMRLAYDREGLIVAAKELGGGARLERAGGELWELAAQGLSLGAMVERLSDPAAGPSRRFAQEAVPALRWLLDHRLIVPV